MADKIASHFPRKKPQGNKPMFPPEGEVALMFLKSYTGLSDDRLVEMLNGNIHMQMFCGVLINPEYPIKDGKIVSAIRNRLVSALDIKELQTVLYEKWSPELPNKDLCLSDATCYESHLRYPTDVKLLWECCQWLNDLLRKTCKELTERMPRSKFADIDRARLSYAKQRKHTYKTTQKLRRRMLQLLGKLIGQWNTLCRQFAPLISLTAEQSKRLDALKKVRRQQLDLMNKKEVRGRIVSIDRPYLRPIVRGKGLSQLQRMQISALPDASSAICEPQLWRAASAIRNYTSGLVLSPLATAAARHCSSSSAYTWPTPQYLPPDNLLVKKKLERKKSGPD